MERDSPLCFHSAGFLPEICKSLQKWLSDFLEELAVQELVGGSVGGSAAAPRLHFRLIRCKPEFITSLNGVREYITKQKMRAQEAKEADG